MAWTSPATPVAGTAITVAFYGTNIKDNLNWLRALTGGGFDPTQAGQLIVSTGVAATVWTQNPTIAGNVTISGSGAIGGALTVGGNLSIGGSVLDSITLASTKRLRFAFETGFKIDLTSSGDSVGIGVGTSKMYLKADGNFEFRDQSDNVRMNLTTSASPALTVGGNTVATLNSANFTALQLGGITVARPATSTYTGDGGTSGRQITVGFVPKIVWLWDQTTGSTMYVCMHDGGSLRLHNAGNPEFTNEVKLHASDGFIVGAGANHRGNDVSEAYRWVAMV